MSLIICLSSLLEYQHGILGFTVLAVCAVLYRGSSCCSHAVLPYEPNTITQSDTYEIDDANGLSYDRTFKRNQDVVGWAQHF